MNNDENTTKLRPNPEAIEKVEPEETTPNNHREIKDSSILVSNVHFKKEIFDLTPPNIVAKNDGRPDEVITSHNLKSNSDREGATESPSQKIISEALKHEYAYAKLGIVLGLFTIVGGVILGINGVTGSTSWTANVLGLESEINDAAPGVVLFLVGIFYIFLTKPKVKINNLYD